jgi:hypothetical protein
MILEEQYLTFQSFSTPGQAQDVAEILTEQNIPFFIDDTSSPIDPVIIGSSMEPFLKLKIRKQDFLKAKILLENYYSKQLDNIHPEYYLFSFSDVELMEIMYKPDEWGSLDYQLAQKILRERGKEITPEKLVDLKNQRLKDISKPDSVELENVWIGYLLSIIISPIGILYGSTILSQKKILPDGNSLYTYNDKSRDHARTMIIISVVLIILWFLSFFLRDH